MSRGDVLEHAVTSVCRCVSTTATYSKGERMPTGTGPACDHGRAASGQQLRHFLAGLPAPLQLRFLSPRPNSLQADTPAMSQGTAQPTFLVHSCLLQAALCSSLASLLCWLPTQPLVPKSSCNNQPQPATSTLLPTSSMPRPASEKKKKLSWFGEYLCYPNLLNSRK